MAAEREARVAQIKANRKAKRKTRGRSKASKRAAKKESNIIDENRVRRAKQLEAQREELRIKRTQNKKGGRAALAAAAAAAWNPLGRFSTPGAQPAG